MKTHFLRLIAGAAMLIAVPLGAPTASAQTTPTPAIKDEGVPLTPGETLMLYQGKTWKWESGAGYFSPDGRQFAAYTGQDDNAAFADGRWLIRQSGALCIRAIWHERDADYPKNDCFDHREVHGTIYQRRLPDGAWYVFRSANDKEAEYSKFERGDLVSDRKEEIEEALRTNN